MIYVQTANKRCFSLNQMEDWAKFVLIYLVFRYICRYLLKNNDLSLLTRSFIFLISWLKLLSLQIKRNKFNLFPTLIHFLQKTFLGVFVHIQYHVCTIVFCWVSQSNHPVGSCTRWFSLIVAHYTHSHLELPSAKSCWVFKICLLFS